MNLPKLMAGVASSLIMSLIWYLASPRDAQPTTMPPPTLAGLAALETPVTLVLTGGQQVSGELRGADSLCADWGSALQASPETVVQLPGGQRVTGADVRTLRVEKTALAGVEAAGSVGACPATLTVYRVGSPATEPDTLNVKAGSAEVMQQALHTLGGP